MGKLVSKVRAVGHVPGAGEDRVSTYQVPDGWVVESLERGGGDLAIAFDDDQVLTVDPGSSRAAETVALLREMSHALTPVYVESDPATNAITRLLLPTEYNVVAVADEPIGDQLVVELAVSHSRHFVLLTHPDSTEIVERLRHAQQENQRVLITEESSRPEIIDVRPLVDPPSALETAPRTTAIQERLAASEVPFVVVSQMFDMLKSSDCWSLSAPLTCIPYSYPDDGCWARAHVGARMMIAKGVTPFKVWSYGPRTCRTANSPSCEVTWFYHVTLYVWARLTDGTSLPMALDPALFNTPATIDEWLARQNGPTTSIEYTDPTVFATSTTSGSGVVTYDPDYVATEKDLNNFRSKLRIRCLLSDPPGPPYMCP